MSTVTGVLYNIILTLFNVTYNLNSLLYTWCKHRLNILGGLGHRGASGALPRKF